MLRATAPFGVRPLGVVALFAIGLAACGGPAAPGLSGSRAVTFESRDGVVREGRLLGDGWTGVVPVSEPCVSAVSMISCAVPIFFTSAMNSPSFGFFVAAACANG